jgi:hypothetical protein
MRNVVLFRILALGLLALIVSAGMAHAQATRTWVSGVGDDANPCSRTAPCKTFAGAISKTAVCGEIDVLDPGGFGALTITKCISIESDDVSVAGVLVSGTSGFVIQAGASDVVMIRGITFDGLGTGLAGIKVVSAGAVFVEECWINHFTGHGIDVEPGAPTTNLNLSIKDTNIRDINNNTGVFGIFIKPAAGVTVNATLDHVRLENSTSSNSGGLRVEDRSKVTVRDSTIANNTGDNGVTSVSTSAPTEVNLDNVTISGNGNGILSVGSGSTVRMNNVAVLSNIGNGLLALSGGGIVSFKNNSIAGNSPDGSPTLQIGQQ